MVGGGGVPRTRAAGAMGRWPRPKHRGFGGCGASGRGTGGLFLSLDWERGCGFGSVGVAASKGKLETD